MPDQLGLDMPAWQPQLVCGVDEAGRGPLFGEVVAAAVILDPLCPITGLGDSKQLSEKVRDRLYELIWKQALAVSIGRASVAEIDQLNILQASMLAMQRAVVGLAVTPDMALIDGNRCPPLNCPATAIVKGDAKEICIGAASIIAKVTRDRDMQQWHARYPYYGLDKHKGYPTKQHLLALAEHGVCDQHRRSFGPVAAILEKQP
ncbi:MAG: ribonuclease HII [Gammaproteobacteria bacterium]|jgi:ribonuclease HII|nr:ribonuclease HII [Gammaproteobacteria bacterium]